MADKFFFWMVIPLLISCSPTAKNSETEAQSAITEETISDTVTDSTGTSSIFLEIINDTAYFKNGHQFIIRTFIKPKEVIGGTPDNPKEIMDEAFLLANCMVILRNIKTAGHFCHIPEVEKVEIYTSDGSVKQIARSERKSKICSGVDFTSDFIGNRFNSPSGEWGLITVEAEGEIYGFLILNNRGEITEVILPKDSTLSGDLTQPQFINQNALIWTHLQCNDKNIILTVNRDGKFIIQ